jgi:hypothetical protein
MQAKKSSNPLWLDAIVMLFGICFATIGRWALNRYLFGDVMTVLDLMVIILGVGVVLQVYRENAARDSYRRTTMALVFLTQGWLFGTLIFAVI